MSDRPAEWPKGAAWEWWWDLPPEVRVSLREDWTKIVEAAFCAGRAAVPLPSPATMSDLERLYRHANSVAEFGADHAYKITGIRSGDFSRMVADELRDLIAGLRKAAEVRRG